MNHQRGWHAIRAAMVLAAFVQKGSAMEPTFGEDVAFLNKHMEIVLLESGDAKVAIAPSLQGRVMTSTASGDDGLAFGWINRPFIAERKTVPHINVYGGEDRFWIGPEGGQFSIFFKKGDAFDLKSWQTPALIDTEPFRVVEKSPLHAVFEKRGAELVNYSGTRFKLNITRTVKLSPPRDVIEALRKAGIPQSRLKVVSYLSTNVIENASSRPWSKDAGLLSIWILGMFKPGSRTTVVIPFQPGSEAELGPKVIDDYFGKVPADRLVVADGVLFFRGDGKFRSKIGLTPQRVAPLTRDTAVMGSYDALAGVLTIVVYDKDPRSVDYVNSKWELQKEPYRGDVANSYNDGPPAPGAKPLGPFYELESSSATRELAAGEAIRHAHATAHFQGTEAELDPIARKYLGVSLAQINSALARPSGESERANDE